MSRTDVDPAEQAFQAAVGPAAERSAATHCVSKAAVMLALRYFSLGVRSSVRTSPPHRVFEENRQAFEELVAKGAITRAAFNDHDVWDYRGSALSAEIAEPARVAAVRHLLA